jgi:hypothetical protein
LNFIFGIVCLFVCVCAFSLRRESPDMILGDKPLIFEVVLSQQWHLGRVRGQPEVLKWRGGRVAMRGEHLNDSGAGGFFAKAGEKGREGAGSGAWKRSRGE